MGNSLFKLTGLASLLLVATSVSANSLSSECESFFSHPSAATRHEAAIIKAQPDWKKDGYYVEAPRSEYEKYFRGDTEFKMPEKIASVGEKDVDVNLTSASARQIHKLVLLGQKNAGRLHYATSAAGAWTRGRGRYKGLQPYNVEDLVSAQELKHLTFIDQFLEKAGDIEAMMAAMEVKTLPKGLSAEKWADQIVDKMIEEETNILMRAIEHPHSINPLDLKFATVALASQKAGTYISFDVWLSLKTHPELGEYIRWFSKNFSQRVFHTDGKVDLQIKRALRNYFEQSAKLGETHIFGYQEGFYGLDMKTGAPLEDTDLLGEGTGMLPIYYQTSGRMAELKAMGKEFFIFDNIETLTDISLIAGAHLKGGKRISSVIVPISEGYKGGAPFLIDIQGQMSIAMIEKDILPKEQQALLPQDNIYFFSGTLVMDFNAVSDKNVITETKKTANGVKYLRLKYMIQDATQFTPSAAIVGATPAMELTNGAGPVYENLKYLREFYHNGPRILEKTRSGSLRRDAR